MKKNKLIFLFMCGTYKQGGFCVGAFDTFQDAFVCADKVCEEKKLDFVNFNFAKNDETST
jgi:hypothetical protein